MDWHLRRAHIPICPVCRTLLQTEGRARFDCAHCGTALKEARSVVYLLLRGIVCTSAAALLALKRGWEPSFIIFVLSFYAIPLFYLWRLIEVRLFPATRFEVVTSPLQHLNFGLRGR